jgi:hypothetical protein
MPLPDFEPSDLLPGGVHPATREDLQERCVSSFAAGSTRPRVFAGFCRYQDAVAALGLSVTEWVDGSFVDRSRLNPEDVDVVNFCDSTNLNAAASAHSASQIQAMLDGRAATKSTFATHTFLVVHFPPGHPFAETFERGRRYWRSWFATPQHYSGTSKIPATERGDKGIVQMTVGDVRFCPVVSTTA